MMFYKDPIILVAYLILVSILIANLLKMSKINMKTESQDNRIKELEKSIDLLEKKGDSKNE